MCLFLYFFLTNYKIGFSRVQSSRVAGNNDRDSGENFLQFYIVHTNKCLERKLPSKVVFIFYIIKGF